MESWQIVVVLIVMTVTVAVGSFLYVSENKRNHDYESCLSSISPKDAAGVCVQYNCINGYNNLRNEIKRKYEKDNNPGENDNGECNENKAEQTGEMEVTKDYDSDTSCSSDESDDDFDEELAFDEKKWPTDCVGIDAPDTWLRSLPQDMKQKLKAQLVRRTMIQWPALLRFNAAYSAKSRFHQMQLLNDDDWNSLRCVFEEIRHELLFIRREAECLQEGWGQSDQVFHNAHSFIIHQKRRAMEKKGEVLKEKRAMVQKEEELKEKRAMVQKEEELKEKLNKKMAQGMMDIIKREELLEKQSQENKLKNRAKAQR